MELKDRIEDRISKLLEGRGYWSENGFLIENVEVIDPDHRFSKEDVVQLTKDIMNVIDEEERVESKAKDTGKKDKNGIELFEGDKVKIDSLTGIYKIVWDDTCFWLKLDEGYKCAAYPMFRYKDNELEKVEAKDNYKCGLCGGALTKVEADGFVCNHCGGGKK